MNFYFEVFIEDKQKEILRLNNQVSQVLFPTKIKKENADIFAEYLGSSTDGSIKPFTFPSYLKVADAAPIHEKDIKENYRPVSILPVFSKTFDKSQLYMSDYFEDVFNKQQSGFCKGYN